MNTITQAKQALRDKFFKECVDERASINFKGTKTVSVAPHDLFEWFWKALASTPPIQGQPQGEWKERFRETFSHTYGKNETRFEDTPECVIAWIEQNLLQPTAQGEQVNLPTDWKDMVVYVPTEVSEELPPIDYETYVVICAHGGFGFACGEVINEEVAENYEGDDKITHWLKPVLLSSLMKEFEGGGDKQQESLSSSPVSLTCTSLNATHPFKVGDRVKVVSTEKVEIESENWLKAEKAPVGIGDEFEVIRAIGGEGGYWIDLNGLKLSHPASKFELLTSKPH